METIEDNIRKAAKNYKDVSEHSYVLITFINSDATAKYSVSIDKFLEMIK